MSRDEHDERDEREKRGERIGGIIRIVGATAPPAVVRFVEAATGTHLPLPTALADAAAVGFSTATALIELNRRYRSEDERGLLRERGAAKRRRERRRQSSEREMRERRHVVEPSPQRTAQAGLEQSSRTKPHGYERELWERGRTGTERGLEPES